MLPDWIWHLAKGIALVLLLWLIARETIELWRGR